MYNVGAFYSLLLSSTYFISVDGENNKCYKINGPDRKKENEQTLSLFLVMLRAQNS
jgi:hypothetical protein